MTDTLVPKPETRRITVNFSGEFYEALLALAVRRGTTMTEVLRDAVALAQWADEQRLAGGRILVERPDGTFREVILP